MSLEKNLGYESPMALNCHSGAQCLACVVAWTGHPGGYAGPACGVAEFTLHLFGLRGPNRHVAGYWRLLVVNVSWMPLPCACMLELH